MPAVTQLFTPDWIVRYMVENSLGRMWVEGHPDDELKRKWKYYLDEAEQEESVQHELDKIKAEYATLKPEDIKLIDPCMGSGHILVYAFDVFMQIYENAGWSQRDAAQSIIKNNIYGLDIDDRAAQLSYFAVLMKARQYDRRILTRGIEPNVYAVQESNGINRDHLKYFGAGLAEEEKKTALMQMEGLLHTLNDAKEYGSLLNVEDYDWELLEKFVEDTDTESQISFDTFGLDETAEYLKQLIRIGKVMAKKYEVVATNPPYMGGSGFNSRLSEFSQKKYPDSKTDLFAMFIEKCMQYTNKNGMSAMITQQAWMTISSYEQLRIKVLNKDIVSLIQLGAHAFDEISGEIVQTVSYVFRRSDIKDYIAIYKKLTDFKSERKKEEAFLKTNNDFYVKKIQFSYLPSSPIAFWISPELSNAYLKGKIMAEYVDSFQGIITGNNDKFLRFWAELDINKISFGSCSMNQVDLSRTYWIPYNKGGEFRKWYGVQDYVVYWKNGPDDKTRGKKGFSNYYLREYVAWSYTVSDTIATRYYPYGFLWDVRGSGIMDKSNMMLYLEGLISSRVGMSLFRVSNSTLSCQVENILQFPVLVGNKEKVDNIVSENNIISKQDWDSFENSWDFKRHPLISIISYNRAFIDDTTDIDLAECYTCWENECNERFNQLKANEEELNRIFIEIYGLQDELTPEVEDKDITVRKADLQRDIKSLVSYAVGCMFGRYSLNKEGLVYAGGEWDESIYPTFAPDMDNIIPICDEEYFSDDIVSRFCEWVKIVYGEKSLETNLDFIAKALGNKGNTSREVIRNYFLNDFFKDHCNTYSVTGSGKRPIYWLFDSGKQNGFKALIYMHRYDADTVGRVRTDYLHKAQKYVETAMQSAQYTIDNATSSSEKSKATKAVTKYTKQLAEMKIYDEAIAHIANQRIEIDLDDGVKVNYAKFQGVEVAQEGKKALKIDLLAKI